MSDKLRDEIFYDHPVVDKDGNAFIADVVLAGPAMADRFNLKRYRLAVSVFCGNCGGSEGKCSRCPLGGLDE